MTGTADLVGWCHERYAAPVMERLPSGYRIYAAIGYRPLVEVTTLRYRPA